MGTIHFNRAGPIAVVELDNPGKRNAVDAPMRDELDAAYATIASDDSIRVAIITGAGDEGFCSGGAIDGYLGTGAFGPGGTGPEKLPKPWPLAKPVVAAIRGHAVGGGFGLALACDLRVVGRGAVLGPSGLRRGVAQGAQQSQRLVRLISPSKALEILLLSKWVGGEEAAAIGLANAVVDDDKVMHTAREWATTIASFSPNAVATTKRLVYEGQHLPLEEAFEWEHSLALATYQHPDALEGFQAFMERREPKFGGG